MSNSTHEHGTGPQDSDESRLKRRQIGEDEIVYQIGGHEYHVHVQRTYHLHDHFGEFTSLEQVERVIRKLEADR